MCSCAVAKLFLSLQQLMAQMCMDSLQRPEQASKMSATKLHNMNDILENPLTGICVSSLLHNRTVAQSHIRMVAQTSNHKTLLHNRFSVMQLCSYTTMQLSNHTYSYLCSRAVVRLHKYKHRRLCSCAITKERNRATAQPCTFAVGQPQSYITAQSHNRTIHIII